MHLSLYAIERQVYIVLIHLTHSMCQVSFIPKYTTIRSKSIFYPKFSSDLCIWFQNHARIQEFSSGVQFQLSEKRSDNVCLINLILQSVCACGGWGGVFMCVCVCVWGGSIGISKKTIIFKDSSGGGGSIFPGVQLLTPIDVPWGVVLGVQTLCLPLNPRMEIYSVYVLNCHIQTIRPISTLSCIK